VRILKHPIKYSERSIFENKNKEVADLAAKIKAAKDLKMAEICKPGINKEKKTKFDQKKKYVNETPKGEKKGTSK
jgi:hypothetical protein